MEIMYLEHEIDEGRLWRKKSGIICEMCTSITHAWKICKKYVVSHTYKMDLFST